MKKLNMRALIICIAMIGSMTLLTQSCLKSDFESNTYTLKGRIMSNYDQLPVRDLHLILQAQPTGFSSEKREIGNTHTDSNGTFIIEGIQTIDSDNLMFRGQFIPQITITPVPKHGDVVDRGDIYVNR